MTYEVRIDVKLKGKVVMRKVILLISMLSIVASCIVIIGCNEVEKSKDTMNQNIVNQVKQDLMTDTDFINMIKQSVYSKDEILAIIKENTLTEDVINELIKSNSLSDEAIKSLLDGYNLENQKGLSEEQVIKIVEKQTLDADILEEIGRNMNFSEEAILKLIKDNVLAKEDIKKLISNNDNNISGMVDVVYESSLSDEEIRNIVSQIYQENNKKQIIMPDVVGLSEEDAINKLNALGISYIVESGFRYKNSENAVVGKIYKQSSASGKNINMNNVVIIYKCTEVINEPVIKPTEAPTQATTKWNTGTSVSQTTMANIPSQVSSTRATVSTTTRY